MLTRPGILLRIEEAALLVGAVMLYAQMHFSWMLFAVGWWLGRRGLEAAGVIWFSHIALDRLLGFGLKYPGAFKDTHLQHVG